MNRQLAVMLIAALAVAQAPATAGPSSTPTTPPALVGPAAAVTALARDGSVEVSAPGMRVEDVLRSRLNPADARSLADVTRGFIESTTGTRLPDLRPDHSATPKGPAPLLLENDTPVQPPPAPATIGTYSYPSPAGDLSGDGLADMVVFDIDTAVENVTLRALRGTNGHQLWSVDLADAADVIAYPVDDVTGDGRADLLMHELRVLEETVDEDCEQEDLCRHEYDATFEWNIGLRSGKDGRRAWSWRYPGSMSYLYSYEVTGNTLTSGASFEESLASTNLDVFPYASGDHNGDGLSDIVTESIDLGWSVTDDSKDTAGILEQRDGGYTLSSQTHAQVLSGNEGTQLLLRSSQAGPQIAFLEPIDDVVGGPAPDLLWEESITPNDTYSCLTVADEAERCTDERSHDFSLELEVIDGGTLEQGWMTAVEGVTDGFSWDSDQDMTGDGNDDILVFVATEDAPASELRLLSGKDGSEVWERGQAAGANGFEYPLAVGQIDGQGGADVVLGTFLVPENDPSEPPDSARLSRVNGATGATLFATEHDFASLAGQHTHTFDFLYLSGAGDADGDGADDALAGSVAIGYELDESDQAIIKEVSSAAVIGSGDSPGVIYEKSAPEMVTLSTAADLDGDGAIDGLELRSPLQPEEPFTLSAVRLAEASTMWAREISEDEYHNGSLWPGGNHDGSAGEDIVYGRNELGDELNGKKKWKSLVASLEGATGSERWRSEK